MQGGRGRACAARAPEHSRRMLSVFCCEVFSPASAFPAKGRRRCAAHRRWPCESPSTLAEPLYHDGPWPADYIWQGRWSALPSPGVSNPDKTYAAKFFKPGACLQARPSRP